MDTTLYVSQFAEKYTEMLNALHKILPENKNINEALLVSLSNDVILNIIKTYIETMTPFYEKMTQKDESIFLKHKLIFFPHLNLQKIWHKKLKKNHKETMWSYLHILYLTGTCSNGVAPASACGVSTDPINFIKNNIDDAKLNAMNDELKNLDENKLKETCNSISSMVGDNDGIISNIFQEIQNELKNPTPSDTTHNPQAQMFQQLFGLQGEGMNNLFGIFENVSKKMGEKVESGELDINKLQLTAQKMMQNLNMNPPK